MTAAITTYRSLTRDLDRTLQLRAADRFTARESAYFSKRIPQVKSVAAFVADRRLLAFALKAHGLSDMTYATAFVRKVLDEGIDRRDALANRLADPRFRQFVAAFNFARHGTLATTFEAAQSETVAKYLRVGLEEEAGRSSEGARLALYFDRQAATIGSPLALLADPALARFARTAAGLPDAAAGLDVDRQAELIGRVIDVERLGEPDYKRRLVTRFLALWDAKQGTAAPGVLPMASQPAAAGFGIDVLMSLQAARAAGGR